MKHLKAILTAILLGSLPVAIHSQDSEYRPMLTDGTEWCYKLIAGSSLEASPEWHRTWGKYIVSGDTIVNGKTYKKMTKMYADPFTDNYYYDYNELPENPYLTYEKDKKFYNVFYNDYLEEWVEYLIMDFNLRQGDLTYWGGDDALTMQVVKEDTITVRGEQYRRLKFKYLMFSDGPVWVEGIGSDTFDTTYNEPTCGTIAFYTEFRRNGKVIFTYDDFFIDSEQTAVTEITTEPEAADDAPYYDLLGRRVANPRPGSTVIRAGRLLRL